MNVFYWLVIVTYTTYGASGIATLPIPYPSEEECKAAASSIIKPGEEFIQPKCIKGYAP